MARKNKNTEVLTESSENAISNQETVGLSQGQIVLRRFVRHRAAMIGLFTLIGIILFAFSASGIHLGTEKNPISIAGWWKYGINDNEIPPLNFDCPNGTIGCPTIDLNPLSPKFGLGDHPFGQDDIGRDYFAMVMRGVEQSVMIMFIIGILAGVIGTTVGAIAGYFRGWIDAILMRFTDLIITVPTIILGTVIGYMYGNQGVVILGLYLGLFAWTGLSRLVRGEFLTLREREFVDAARVAGASSLRIIFKHILPNAVGIIIVSVTLSMSGAILLETALSYIGFGVVAPDVSLGSVVSQYKDAFSTRPWLFWWPGFFIIAIALCINFIGDGLRDAFDPRQRRRITRKDRLNAKVAKREQA
jgi:ABC-type dipeptide/oligopeptide/nickel transport system permease subunit